MQARRPCVFTIVLVVAAALAAGPSVAAAKASAASSPLSVARAAPRFVPRQVLVRFQKGVTLGAARRLATANGARVETTLPQGAGAGRLVVVRSATLSTRELLAEFAADPRVDRVEPDYILRVDATPNDPEFSALWGISRIRAPGAWDLTTGASSVVVADIDTGVDYAHPDLAANMWHNPGEIAGNGLDDDGNGYVDDVYGMASADDVTDPGDPMDVQGHGTHTAGIIAGVGDNGVGVTGVAWRAGIMALRFFDAQGLGATSDAMACIDYVVAMKERGVNVVAINASWGSSDDSVFLRWAIQSAGDAGIVVVAAAGNGGADKIGDDNDVAPFYPASFDCSNIISVAASTLQDALSEFSNFGASSVDLAAPGTSIRSTVPAFVDAAGYASKNGSSFAAPHVTGTIALCAALYPDETAAQRIARVLGSADPVAALDGRCVTGGRLDALGALDREAPTTTATGIDDRWHAAPVTVSFAASDSGSGVAGVESSLDGAPYASGASCTVGGNGRHALSYRAVDVAGNVERANVATVLVDAGRPVTRALAKAAARKGQRATLRFSARDVTPRAAFAIKVFDGRRPVKTLRVGLRRTNSRQAYSWFCRLPKGTYTWRVYATDLAGNRQRRVGSQTLTVR